MRQGLHCESNDESMLVLKQQRLLNGLCMVMRLVHASLQFEHRASIIRACQDELQMVCLLRQEQLK